MSMFSRRITAVLCAVLGTGLATAAPAQAAPTRWAAIAYSPSNGNSEAVWNRSTGRAAIDDAVRLCNQNTPPPTSFGSSVFGGPDCRALVWNIRSGWCAAVAENDDHDWAEGWARDRTAAELNALNELDGDHRLIRNSVCQS